MRDLAFFLLAVLTAFCADDPWAKVRELKSGTEIRIFKKGSMQPILARMDEATGDSLIVVVKNEQVAIPRELVDRLDYRPPQPGGRVKKETISKVETPEMRAGEAPSPREVPGQTTTTSTNYVVGSKPDFETIYRRPPPASAKPAPPPTSPTPTSAAPAPEKPAAPTPASAKPAPAKPAPPPASPTPTSAAPAPASATPVAPTPAPARQ
jgi:hypothetical protein